QRCNFLRQNFGNGNLRQLGSHESGSLKEKADQTEKRSDAEDAGGARLDGAALLLHGRGIVLQALDVLERRPALLFLGLRVQRTQSADIDDELLGLAAEAERLKEFRRVGIGRTFENAVR